MQGQRFRLPRKYYAGAALGGISCLTLAGLTVAWTQVALMAMSAIHWVLLVDLFRCGVWLRDDGIDVRIPLQGSFRRMGWREIESIERRPKKRVIVHLDDGRAVSLPRVREQEELVSGIETHVS